MSGGTSGKASATTEKFSELPATTRNTEKVKIPEFEKLSGAPNYPKWSTILQTYFELIDIGETDYTVWDVITGNYGEVGDKIWKRANGIALLTINKNCETDVGIQIGSYAKASKAYAELKKAYEGKTTTEY